MQTGAGRSALSLLVDIQISKHCTHDRFHDGISELLVQLRVTVDRRHLVNISICHVHQSSTFFWCQPSDTVPAFQQIIALETVGSGGKSVP